MAIWQFALLFLASLAAGSLAFVLPKIPRAQLKIVLSFSGAYIFGISVLHLLPDVFSQHQAFTGHFILAGFFVQLLLEQLSKGIEHGHLHPTHEASFGFVLPVMFGLSLHAFMEGLPLTAYPEGAGAGAQSHLFWGIVLHEMPASFTLAALLLLSGFRKGVVLICLIVKSLMSPLGAWVAGRAEFSPEVSVAVTALVIGLFLHIATTILFESDSDEHHHIVWSRLGAIGLGVALAVLI